MLRTLPLLLADAATLLALAGPAAAADRFFSYDPANAQTRATAGDLTFQFKQRLVWNIVLAVRSTEGEATADLKPANEGVFGAGGLARIVPGGREHDLYEVTSTSQGADMVHAFCPGSQHAWMAIGRLSEGAPLRVRVIGDTPGGGRAHLCQTFDFTYHGEWRLPPGAPPPPERDLLQPKFPY
ncbi:MAG TPA: hypothetical protein VHW60_16440 [Caulobacteraceae bacterium]|jgi:hypothetical protein|nr:hypothetical protein [Caulobacteraceae bacterium]